jgi:hypothetical protein
MTDFDPTTFIDREFEQELFANLLTFQDAARILAICDNSGMGKSRLLQMFRYRCRTNRPRIPVSLIDFRQMIDLAPMDFLKELVKDLSRYEVPFPAFKQAESARHSGDFSFIRSTLERLHGPLDRAGQTAPSPPRGDAFTHYETGLERLLASLHNDHPRYTEVLIYEQRLRENIMQARLFGNDENRNTQRAEIIVQLNTLTPEVVGQSFNQICGMQNRNRYDEGFFDMPQMNMRMMDSSPAGGKLTAEQDETAREVCITSFAQDIQQHSAERPMVLLLDSYEYCGERLDKWLRDHFLEQYFFDVAKRPTQLLLVVAGQRVPAFASNWAEAECISIVRSVHEMGKWSRNDVETCLRVHGFPYTAHDVEAFAHLVERGLSPSQIVNLILSLSGKAA